MATKASRVDTNDFAPGLSPRTSSAASDVRSFSTRSVAGGSAPQVSPSPQFIGEAAASQLVSAELDRTVTVSTSALELVNGFLDQILYTIFARAHSTSLSALRASVPIVLKQRLGTAALKVADEEMTDYLDEEDEEELREGAGISEPNVDFDLNLAWKLARLRCMVYARLGDMEEQAEEEYLEQDGLQEYLENPSLNTAPASAIFLSTILEFLGEQTLCVAGQHAERRHHVSMTKKVNTQGQRSPTVGDDIIIDRSDMIAVGRDGALSKLWRSWRRDTRSSEALSPRPITPSVTHTPRLDSPFTSRKNSINSPIPAIPEEKTGQTSLNEVENIANPSQIPLPMNDNDVNEIEVPGLAREIVDEGEQQSEDPLPVRNPRRPSSMVFMPGNFPRPPSPVNADTDIPELNPPRPQTIRARSRSVPHLGQLPHQRSQGQETKGRTKTIQSSIDKSTSEKDVEDGDDTSTKEQTIVPPDEGKRNTGRTSIISGTVAALAGALGVEAMRARSRRESPSASTQNHSIPRPIKSKTSTDSGVIPGSEPSASMTGSSELNGIHVSSGQDSSHMANSVHSSAGSSDPEDLALSSADENEQTNHYRHGLRDSGLGVIIPSTGHTPDAITDEGVSAANAQHDTLYHGMNHAQHRIVPDHEGLQYDPTDEQNLRLHTEAGSPETVYEDAVPNLSTVSSALAPKQSQGGAQITSAWPAVVPPRRSSIEQQRATTSSNEARMSQMSQNSQNSSTSARFVGLSRDPQNIPQSYGNQRAGQTESGTGNRAAHSRASSAARERPGTSGSTSASKRQYPRLYADSEEAAKGISPIEDTAEAKKKSLEILLRSDETLHYTLTPESARAETHEYNRNLSKPKTQTQELAEFFKNTAPPGSESNRPRTSRSAKESMNGIRTATAVAAPVAALSMGQKVVTPKASATQVISPQSSKPRNPLGEPRDAREERNTTRDLADYARSTGPATETQLPRPLSPRPDSPSMSRTIAGASNTNETPVIPNSKSVSGGIPAPSNPEGPTNRLKFQARDARPSREGHSELIDFIREGPPRAPGEHRIDRRVAPFRSTMDSEELNALAPQQINDNHNRDSLGSAQESSIAAKSMHSSMNSRTGLLESSNRAVPRIPNGAHSNGNSIHRQPVIHEADNGMPKRTRRRVKDPYAIDDSDEEDLFNDDAAEDGEELIKSHPRSQQETLIDFLRNTAPAPGMTTPPVLAPNSKAVQDAVQLNRQTSNRRFRDMLNTTNNNTASATTNVPDSDTTTALPTYKEAAQNGGQGTNATLRPTNATTRPVNGSSAAREVSPHLTQVGSKYDKYRPTQTTHAAHVDRHRQQNQEKVQQQQQQVKRPKAEPREPSTRSNGRATAELAEYLRTSGPPPNSEQRPVPLLLASRTDSADGGVDGTALKKSVSLKDQAGFLKFFSRRGSVRNVK